MNLVQFALNKIAEEASEVAKAALKAQNFGVTSRCPGSPTDNLQDLINELNDLLGAVALFELVNGDMLEGYNSIEAKRAKVSKILRLAEVPLLNGNLKLSAEESLVFNDLVEVYMDLPSKP